MIYEIILKKTFGETFFFNMSPNDILNNFDNYLNIENSFLKTIDTNILENIKNKKLTLIVKLTNEGDIDIMGIQIFEKLLNHYGIPNTACILIHDSYRLPTTSIKSYQIHNHLFSKSDESINLSKEKKLNISVLKNKKYKFHLPIRRFRYHRLLLLDKLFSKYPNFIDSNLISYDINTENNNEKLKSSNISEPLKEYMLSNVVKHIDVNDIENVKGYRSEFQKVYSKSYFTIVTETYFFEPYYYISEKSFKPIAHMHPFIIFGRPGILAYLKKFGFKTFHPFIDESYDLEENNDKRFEMVYNEIVKLNELSDEELDNFMDKIKDILHYNQQKLLQMGGQAKMIHELNGYIIKNLDKKNLI
jgi:hypothetical protein